MHQHTTIIIGMLLFAGVATAVKDYGRVQVHQVPASALPVQLHKYLNDGPSAASAASAATAQDSSMPSYKPASSYQYGGDAVLPASYGIAAPSAYPAYNQAPAAAVAPASSGPAYVQAPINLNVPLPAPVAPAAAARYDSYNHGLPAPKLNIQPAYSAQLYPGPIHYKTYKGPSAHNTISLQTLPGAPIATLYNPMESQQKYGGAAYPAASYPAAAYPASYSGAYPAAAYPAAY